MEMMNPWRSLIYHGLFSILILGPHDYEDHHGHTCFHSTFDRSVRGAHCKVQGSDTKHSGGEPMHVAVPLLEILVWMQAFVDLAIQTTPIR